MGVYTIQSENYLADLLPHATDIHRILRVWELATAIKVSSNLPEKFEIAYDMRQLGDLSRDLSDDIS